MRNKEWFLENLVINIRNNITDLKESRVIDVITVCGTVLIFPRIGADFINL